MAEAEAREDLLQEWLDEAVTVLARRSGLSEDEIHAILDGVQRVLGRWSEMEAAQNTLWIAGIDPDVEWADYPEAGPHPTREAAIDAIRALGDIATPDEHGAEPHPWIMPVTHEEIHGWAPHQCTCYGRTDCAACQLAREYIVVE